MEKKNRLRIIALVCAVIAAAAAVLCFALSEQNKKRTLACADCERG